MRCYRVSCSRKIGGRLKIQNFGTIDRRKKMGKRKRNNSTYKFIRLSFRINFNDNGRMFAATFASPSSDFDSVSALASTSAVTNVTSNDCRLLAPGCWPSTTGPVYDSRGTKQKNYTFFHVNSRTLFFFSSASRSTDSGRIQLCVCQCVPFSPAPFHFHQTNSSRNSRAFIRVRSCARIRMPLGTQITLTHPSHPSQP